MATDVPGIECVNHTPGPPVPCECGRFYRNTYCDPPRWWSYNQSVSQPPSSIWAWLNSLDYIPTFKNVPNNCRWLFYDANLVTGEIHSIGLAFDDNPDYDPLIPTHRFVCTIGLLYREPPAPPVGFEAKKPFDLSGPGVPRSHTFGTVPADWTKISGEPEDQPPIGFQLYIPAFCIPDA